MQERYHEFIRRMTAEERQASKERERANTMPSNKDFLVTVKVTFTKSYIVNARDWEYAEDYAKDEAYGDVYSTFDEDCEVEVYELEEV